MQDPNFFEPNTSHESLYSGSLSNALATSVDSLGPIKTFFDNEHLTITSGELQNCQLKPTNIDRDMEIPTKCFVCGHPTNCCNYGAPSCHGCKLFFRRSLLASKTYACKLNGMCIKINGIGRCRACRFDRCVLAGMNPRTIKFPISVDVAKLSDKMANRRNYLLQKYGEKCPALIEKGTMEQRIYNRQVTKVSTAKRVTEEAQIQRHFEGHDLHKLYKFDPKDIPQGRGDGQAPRLSLPKDRLLAGIILSHGSAIESYMTHDTLFDEKLTDEYRAKAWEEYNKEKNRTRVNVQNNSLQNGPDNAFVNLNRIVPPADFVSNVFIDPIYQKCFDVPQMTNEIASQIVVIKRFLDYLMVGIPQEVRGGLNEFGSFFVSIIDQTKGSNALDLFKKSMATFRTTVSIISRVPTLAQPLNLIRSIAPILFADDNSTML